MKPGEVEFGHLRLDRSGATVESRCSGWAVDARVREIVKGRSDSPLARLVGGAAGSEAKHLGAALEQGDECAQEVLDPVAADLGFALSHVVHLFHPEVVVMGGGLSLLGEPLRAGVQAAMQPHVMEVFQPGPTVRLAELREDSVPVGALLLAGSRMDGR
jgi:glucokinase